MQTLKMLPFFYFFIKFDRKVFCLYLLNTNDLAYANQVVVFLMLDFSRCFLPRLTPISCLLHNGTCTKGQEVSVSHNHPIKAIIIPLWIPPTGSSICSVRQLCMRQSYYGVLLDFSRSYTLLGHCAHTEWRSPAEQELLYMVPPYKVKITSGE